MTIPELYNKWDSNREHSLSLIMNKEDYEKWSEEISGEDFLYKMNLMKLPSSRVILTIKPMFIFEMIYKFDDYEVEVFQCDDDKMTIYLQKRQGN